MRKYDEFDPFEFSAIIVPGAAVLPAIALLVPALLNPAQPKTFDGAVAIAIGIAGSYLAGHVVAALSNLVQGVFTFAGGGDLESIAPAGWVEHRFLSEPQFAALRKHYEAENWDVFADSDGAALRLQRRMFVKQLRINAPPDSRIETFAGLTTLSKGLALAFFIDGVCALRINWAISAVCFAGTALMLLRVRRFTESYAREVLQQTLRALPLEPAPEPPGQPAPEATS